MINYVKISKFHNVLAVMGNKNLFQGITHNGMFVGKIDQAVYLILKQTAILSHWSMVRRTKPCLVKYAQLQTIMLVFRLSRFSLFFSDEYFQ